MTKRTSLYQVHISAGAKMVDFAGWEMPIQYKGIMSEHNAVREKVGIFDVSHMGEIEVQGPQALEFCQLISTNDVSTLEPGRVQYSCFLDRKGGIIDDCTLYQLGKDHYLFVVNAASKDRVLDWFVTNSIEGAQVKDQSDRYALIALQGKNAEPLLSKVVHKNLSSIEYYGFAWIEHEGHAVMVSRTGYTGEDGFELYIPWDHAQALWNVLLSEGQEYGIQAVGLGARDTLRLEMGYLLYGQDMSMDTNPIEAGLQWICKMNKGTFIGKEAILAVKEKGPEKKLRALQLMGKGVPRSGYKVYEDTREIGQLSSGTFSPSIKSGIALGYLPSEYRLGSIVQIDLRGKRIPAKLVKGPFVSPSTKKSS